MRFLSVILLLISTTSLYAGHRVALVIGGNDAVEQSLAKHGFRVTRQDDLDDKKIKETLNLFIRGVPTKGLALIYTNQKEPEKLLKRLHKESGAEASIVLSEGDDLPAKLTGSKNLNAVAPPDQVQAGKAAAREWVNAYGMVFCWCPQKDQGFWMGKYEVTLREFNAVTRKTPRHAIASRNNHPRDGIHYDDISQFVRQLNQRERFSKRLPDGWEYALPSESQWAHVAKVGKIPMEKINFADASLFDTGDDFYHYADRSLNDGQASLAIVGSYPPNPWGVHDLFGNLWEWTSTPKGSGNPIACGGSWVSLPHDCSPTSRRKFPKRTEKNFIGFRLILQQKTNATSLRQ